jgi:hypothetical protein
MTDTQKGGKIKRQKGGNMKGRMVKGGEAKW